MSDNGSHAEKLSDNGSNVSIEEIGPDEIEQIGEIKDEQPAASAAAEAQDESVKAEPAPEAADAKPAAVADSDDPPLENLAPNPTAAAAVTEAQSTDSTFATDKQPAENNSETTAAVETGGETGDPKPAPAAVAAGDNTQAAPQAADEIEEVPRPAQADPPVKKPQKQEIVARLDNDHGGDDDDDDDDDDIDETLTERLIGLTEMFPECVRNGSCSLVKGTWSATKSAYGMSRSVAWIFFSTASILFMPVIIETERMSIMDQQKQQKTQMLLGPGVAASGAPSLGPPPI